jgi:MoxR-like ATPase
MFNPKVLRVLAEKFNKTFKKLKMVEDILNQRFADLEKMIRALALSVASGEPMLLVGPPGTGKSRLIRAFCGLTGMLDEDDPSKGHQDYFEYLLTPFTEPGELFGFYDIRSAMEEKELKRMDKGMMQHARVVYLDEVFNGSSAILNTLLAFLNERIFHDRNERKVVALECLFAATNHIPQAPELKAVFDRFLIRCHMENVTPDPQKVSDLLRKGWKETYSFHTKYKDFNTLLPELEKFRQTIRNITMQGHLVPEEKSDFYKGLTQLIHYARQYELTEMSNRRMVKMLHVMLLDRIYKASCSDEFKQNTEIAMGPDQLELLPLYFLDRHDEEAERQMIPMTGPAARGA